MKLLNPEQVETEFAKLPLEWTLAGGVELQLPSSFKDFKAALSYVNKVGALAESYNHHPDISLSYGKVVISLTTHSAGGLTEKDFHLAKEISNIS